MKRKESIEAMVTKTGRVMTGVEKAPESLFSAMKIVWRVLMGIFFISIYAAPCLAKEDAKNCKDHPLLTRLPNYWISSCNEKQFDSYKFKVEKDYAAVEGHFWEIRYQPPADLAVKPSYLQVLRNVENAVKQIGGKLVTSYSQKITMTLAKGGKELWVEAWADHTGKYILTIVQKDAMVQEIAANADAFANSLKATGHIAVEGIYFDTGKATLKPESQQAISEIIKLLKADSGLKVFVVGHTDNAGAVDGNMKLSQDRAQAVVKELTGGGITAARLKAFGNGPYAPVSSNDTEEGRAKNRRVELVKQ